MSYYAQSFFYFAYAEKRGTMQSDNLDTTQLIGKQLAEYAKCLANFTIACLRNSSKDLKFETAGAVLLLIDNEFITVSTLAKKLAKNAGGCLIYELWVSNYRSLILSYRAKLNPLEFDALYSYANVDGDIDAVSADAVSSAVRQAASDLYGDDDDDNDN